MVATPDRRKLLAVNLSLAADVALSVLKTFVGVVGRSPALLAEGIHSIVDVAYLAIVRIFMRQAGVPPDREHPFGHRQFESIAALVVGAFIMTTGIAIFWAAISKVYELLSGRIELPGATGAAVWVAVATVALKIALAVFTRRVGRQTQSLAVLALSLDQRNDVISMSVAMAGILLGRLGYVWFDPLAAALVGLVILLTGISILRESSADLMNVLPAEEVTRHIRRLLGEVPGVEDVEDIRVHRIGVYLMVDVILGIDGRLTVAEGDAIASRAEEALQANIEYLRDVTVHYHPARQWAGD
jgi:cation diffusion facilitator family transporter